jgi:hypothetical protein
MLHVSNYRHKKAAVTPYVTDFSWAQQVIIPSYMLQPGSNAVEFNNL